MTIPIHRLRPSIATAGYLGGLLLAVAAPMPTHAAIEARTLLALRLNEPFLIPLDTTFGSPPNISQDIRVKICFSDIDLPLDNETNVTNLNCQGETWNGDKWLAQHDEWNNMPIISVSPNGQVVGHIIGRVSSGGQKKFLYLLRRQVGSTTNRRILQSYQPGANVPLYDLSMRSYNELGQLNQEGYFIVNDNTLKHIVPIFNGQANTRTAEQTVNVAYYRFGRAEPDYSEVFTQIGNGVHLATLNFRSGLPAIPQIIGPDSGYAGQPLTLKAATDVNYRGSYHWSVDNQPAESTDQTFRPSFKRSGTYRIDLRLDDQANIATRILNIQTYNKVVILSLLPNPVGVDTKSEVITLKNNHDVPAILDSWQLRRRDRPISYDLTGTISPGETHEFRASNFLLNTGGSYDLYDSAGNIVDTATIPPSPEGVTWTRDGIFWPDTTPPALLSQSSSPSPAPLHRATDLSGTVVLPSGRTIDISTDTGEPIRIVLHSSYRLPKPALRRGDRVRASGEWRQSSRGTYLSVRAGDTFELITPRATTSPGPDDASRSVASRAASSPPATTEATQQRFEPIPQAQAAGPGPATLPRGATGWRPWLWRILITFGSILAIPYRIKKSV